MNTFNASRRILRLKAQNDRLQCVVNATMRLLQADRELGERIDQVGAAAACAELDVAHDVLDAALKATGAR